MQDPRTISITDFNYDLPEEKIAKFPLAERDDSRLLIYLDGAIRESRYKYLAEEIPENSLIVFNNTLVIAARILFQKPTGGMIELFCLEPEAAYPDMQTALAAKGRLRWKCFIGGASKWKAGQLLSKKIDQEGQPITLSAKYIEKQRDSFLIEFSWEPGRLSFAEVIAVAGAMPLPPYIKRSVEPSDLIRYQTVYAQEQGSVAAPTAGLHFTPAVFESLREKRIETSFLTLHVGAGTFKPVTAAHLQDHMMHAEWMQVSRDTIEQLQKHLDGLIIAAGTTSLRSLESLYWLGVQVTPYLHPGNEQQLSVPLELNQWSAYEHDREELTTKQSLANLLRWMDLQGLDSIRAKTQILIAPGYRPRIIKGLITNFHQPQSTLLLLIAALIGDEWKKVYAYALERDFRFLSYGDGSLILI